MGLNDFIQRLATNSYACKQWVSTHIWLILLFCAQWRSKHWETQPNCLVILHWRNIWNIWCVEWCQSLNPLNLLVQIFGHLCGDELSLNSVWLLLCFSSEVQSILNLSPPQDPELMNTNPSPPVSKMNCAIYRHILCFHAYHTCYGSNFF